MNEISRFEPIEIAEISRPAGFSTRLRWLLAKAWRAYRGTAEERTEAKREIREWGW